MEHRTEYCPDRYSINGVLTCTHSDNQPTSVIL